MQTLNLTEEDERKINLGRAVLFITTSKEKEKFNIFKTKKMEIIK